MNEFGKEEVKQERLSLFQEKVYYQRLPGILSTLLTLNFSLENHAVHHALIPIENNSLDFETIKRIKSHVLDLLLLLLDIFEPFISKIDITKFSIYQAIQNENLKFILHGLISFLNVPEYMEVFENNEIVISFT